MQYIDKKLAMPEEVQKWVKKHNPKEWLGKDPTEKALYDILTKQLRQEQNGLCCYCGQGLEEYVTIEHLKCRDKHKHLTYVYDNLLLSCTTPKQCDNAKSNKDLALTPLMLECDIELKINIAGRLEGSTPRAIEAIEILNLNEYTLCEKRKALIDMIQFTFDPTSKLTQPLKIRDNHTLNIIINSLTGVDYYVMQYILKKLGIKI